MTRFVKPICLHFVNRYIDYMKILKQELLLYPHRTELPDIKNTKDSGRSPKLKG